MRRMYSEQELTKVIKNVVGGMITDGDFDEVINNSIQAYMDAHPSLVLTSLETASLTATSINGENNPSVKPIYYHGIEMFRDSPEHASITLTILNNSDTAIDTITKVKNWALGLPGKVLISTNGNLYYNSTYYELYGILKKENNNFDLFCLDDSHAKVRIYDVDFDSLYTGVNDNTNKLN